jgi:hypothetical protein
MKIKHLLVSTLGCVFLVNCHNNTNSVELKNPQMNPSVYKVDADYSLTAAIEVIDPKYTVGTIEFSFPDIPPAPKVMLNDDGQNGDKVKGDHIWSGHIPLPPKNNIPIGEFKIQFKAIGKDNLPIKNISKEEIIASTTVKFTK